MGTRKEEAGWGEKLKKERRKERRKKEGRKRKNVGRIKNRTRKHNVRTEEKK